MTRARRPIWPSLAAIGVVAIFGVYLWAWNDAQSAFGDVRVVADATPLQCSGIEPGYVEQDIDSSSTFTMSRIELRSGMECQVEFHIHNVGSRDVGVQRVVIPFGAAGAQGALAVRLDWESTLPEAHGANDAAFNIDLTLRPGERRRFVATISFQEGICIQPGGTVMFDDYIRLGLRRWVFSGSPGVELVPIAFSGTDDTAGCLAATDPASTDPASTDPASTDPAQG